jgi:Na+-transporting NADH:ubiquinone oxidoreductase subunit A
MAHTIKIKKGFDINLKGKAEPRIRETSQPETFAVKPTDFLGIKRPKVLVEEGDTVKAGQPLLYCKMRESIKYCAPVSGEVVEVKRGAKRRLLEIKILADKEMEYEQFNKYSVSDLRTLDRQSARDQMLKSGVWPNIIQRPFGIVADPDLIPKSIFISSFDTSPLAPDYDFIFDDAEHFQAGLEVLKKFSEGQIHVGLNGNAEVSKVFSHSKDVELHTFSGPHPTGNVGVQIHHIDPINKGDIVWTLNPYGVIQIGKLFSQGVYDASKTIAIVGSEVKEPAYVKTYSGAQVSKFLENNIQAGKQRVISGNVLTGEKINPDGYLGYYDHMVTVIPEGDYEEMFGWILPSLNKLSFHKAFGLLSFLRPKKNLFNIDTNMHGERRAFVMTGVFEKVLPMDIYPNYLFKAIMAEDYDEMEELGIFEVVEEDVALCEFIDVSKHDLQKTLREGLNLIQNS